MIKNVIKNSETAFYTFDISILKERIKYLRTKLPQNVSLCFAVKSNPFIIKEIEQLTDRYEICSPGEAEIFRELKIAKNKAVISGVYKTPAFIESVIADKDFDGIFTIESEPQLQMFNELTKKYDKKIVVLLRLTNDSQFGMNESAIENIIRNREDYPFLSIEGIQFFSGTQKKSLKKLKKETDYLDGFLCHLKKDLLFDAKRLEYGPGFPVSYFESDQFDENSFLDEFSRILEEMSFKTAITLELGRSIAATCGKYYTHIVDIKSNKGMNYVIVDGGMHHLVYYDQQMAMKVPKMYIEGKEEMPVEQAWTLCGSLCSMNDIMVKQMPLPKFEIGDTICFENTGAYCMTEGMALFLSRDLPAIYLLYENGEAKCVRSSFETHLLNTPRYERNLNNGKIN